MKDRILVSHDEVRQAKWNDPEYRKAYRRLKPRYDVVRDLLRLRHDRGLTQEQLAKQASTHQSRVSRIESAEDDFRLSTLVAMAEALGADVEIRLIARPGRAFFRDVTEILDQEIQVESAEENWTLPKSTGVEVEMGDPIFA